MPPIRPTHVVSFSSEDPNNPASNLLQGETFRKWKCKEPGEKTAYVILQLEKAVTVSSIDIGNEHSAHVEVLVGRSGQSPQTFEVLLSQSSFMSPKDSRESVNVGRVRMFGQDKFDKTIAAQKWDLVKVVCVQDFNTHVQFGLSFITINTPLDPNDKPKIGGFSLRPSLGATDEAADSVHVGGLFAKRLHGNSSSPASSAPTTTAAKIRQASASIAGVAIASSEERVKELKKHKLGPDADDPDVIIGRSQSPRSRSASPVQRKSSWYGSPTSPAATSNKTNTPKPAPAKTPTVTNATPNNVSSSSKNSKVTSSSSGSGTVVRSTAAGSSLKNPSTKSKKKSRKTKPFSKLFEDVVFVMSGFVNPYRAALRSKACQMGARCKNDWDSTCTHLICAFVNTPKFREVRQSGHGKIVKKEWIESSYSAKCRFPWRRYCLDRNDQGSASEEEVYAETDGGMEEDEDSSPERDSEDEGVTSKSVPKRDAASDLSGPSDEDDDQVGVKVKTKSPKRRRILEIESDEEENEAPVPADTTTTTTASQEDAGKADTEAASKGINDGVSPSASDDIFDADTDVEDKDDDGGSSPSMLVDCNANKDDFFEGKVFYLHGAEKGLSEAQRNVAEIIRRYKGEIETTHTARVEYVLTDGVQWEEDFSEAMAENPNLTFVQAKWIVECEKENEMISPDPFMILPN